MYGVQPGPLLFQNQPTLVWGLLTSFFIGNVILLVLNLPLAPVFAQALRLNYSYLYPAILFFSMLGAFAVENNLFALTVLFFSGLAGFFLKKYDFPTAPLILGLVLGPMVEKALVQTSSYANGDLTVIFTEPLALTILIITVGIMLVPNLMRRITHRSQNTEVGSESEEGLIEAADAPVAVAADASAPLVEAVLQSSVPVDPRTPVARDDAGSTS